MEDRGDERGARATEHGQAAPRDVQHPGHAPLVLERHGLGARREQHRGEQQPSPDPENNVDAGVGPTGKSGHDEDVRGEPGRRNNVERTMRQDRSGHGRPARSAVGDVARQYADARELTHPAGKRNVRDQANGEGREDVAVRGMRLGNRLLERDLPGGGAQPGGKQVRHERAGHPRPFDRRERVLDRAQIGRAPDENPNEQCRKRANNGESTFAGVEEPASHTVRTGAAARSPVKSS